MTQAHSLARSLARKQGGRGLLALAVRSANFLLPLLPLFPPPQADISAQGCHLQKQQHVFYTSCG
ncbi:hypothetical protein Taro_026789 [Colocasia esculenta]|uniref:Uncharacterized protein n=1 Tax=Colocasia esculenta TaxID=4460 RepID=A0A843VCA2_COLES|nr:hypothetical protein [Colocasia esculenta]